MPPISLLIKPASGNCNMRCDYCFYCDEAGKRTTESFGFMEEKTLKNVIRKFVLAAEGSCTIAFQGGEPTLRGLGFFRKVIDYVNQYNKNHIRIAYALQTNGYHITEEWCEFLRENEFLVGVSVDGTRALHDRYRHGKDGAGSYDRVLEAIRLFDAYGVEYNILTVIHRHTAAAIGEIYREYQKRGWQYLQFITCLDPLGEVRGQQEYSLLPEEYGNFLNTLFDLWYRDWKKGRQPYIRQFENYVGILLGRVPESCEQRGVCGIQNVVEANGNVYPCDFYALDDYCLGNINEIGVAKIAERRAKIGFVERSRNHSPQCRACPWFSLCRGGCYRSREGETDNYFCRGYQMFFEKNYDRLAEIAKAVGR